MPPRLHPCSDYSLSLPLSEWVWRDHEPSFTQLLRCRVQVQDPEIISSKIIWASPKNRRHIQKTVYLRRRLITTIISQHTRVKILREGSPVVVSRRHDRVRWCRVLAALTLCRPTLGWAGLRWAGLGLGWWAGLGWATLPSMQFTHTQAPTPNIHHYLRITTCKYGPGLGTYFPWELHCGCSLWLNLKVNISRLAFVKLLCIECYNLHAMWTSKYSKKFKYVSINPH